jgi:hypothetical protein
MSPDGSVPVDTIPDDELPTFSPMRGGPIYRALVRLNLSGGDLEWPWRRMLAVAAVTWLPLLVLAGRQPVPGGIDFLHDVEAHLRFLVAIPILIAGEMVAQIRFLGTVKQFVLRGIVLPRERPRYQAIVASARRVADSNLLDLGIVLFVYTAGHWLWRSQIAMGSPTWYSTPAAGGGLDLTRAGLWYAWVSLPIAQIVTFRWVGRLVVWYWYLWKTSRLDLYLTATHPDNAGGLAFVGVNTMAFAPLLLSQGIVLAGIIANRIFYEGQTLASYKVDIVGLVLFELALILLPLTMFSPLLGRTKRVGLGLYGALAARYSQDFESKWVLGGAPPGEPLIGSSDIQSLADMCNSFTFVKAMRWVPFGWQTVYQLALVMAAPILPLTLTAIPLEELVDRLLKTLL